jgi:hypothetical protein
VQGFGVQEQNLGASEWLRGKTTNNNTPEEQQPVGEAPLRRTQHIHVTSFFSSLSSSPPTQCQNRTETPTTDPQKGQNERVHTMENHSHCNMLQVDKKKSAVMEMGLLDYISTNKKERTA